MEVEPLSEVMVVPPPPGPELEDEAPPKDCALQSNTPARPRAQHTPSVDASRQLQGWKHHQPGTAAAVPAYNLTLADAHIVSFKALPSCML